MKIRLLDTLISRAITVLVGGVVVVHLGSLLLHNDTGGQHEVVLSTTVMTLGVIAVSVLLMRMLSRPLVSLARAAARLDPDHPSPPLAIEGPREIREAASAFNEMQERIVRLVRDRTDALAGLSHDLRTPVTRLRLAAEFIHDAELHDRVSSDLREIESMIEGTLAYLRNEAEGEPKRLIDLVALAHTLVDERSDAGFRISVEGVTRAPAMCRPVAIKRALSNVIDNALRYGGSAEIITERLEDSVQIVVADRGMGMTEEEQRRAFEPFWRSERARVMGLGSGLGLAIAKRILCEHGGAIGLANRPGGGLLVTIRLPQPAQG